MLCINIFGKIFKRISHSVNFLGKKIQPSNNFDRRKNFLRTFPILKWGNEYTVGKLISDIIAGITVGLTVLPQGLAYATVAGLPPIVSSRQNFAV